MIGRSLLFGATALLTLGAATSAFAGWSKSYVIEWNEHAMYYGGPKDGGVTDPGTDCPAGANPEPNWVKVLMDAGYTKQEADWLRDPSHPFRIPNHGQNQMAFRGKNRANIYIDPESTPDPGLTPVSGKIAEGINLDGNTSNGFVSPTGAPGIDNEFYRALGCWMTHRGPPRLSGTALSRNDEMQGGSWTVVIVVAGEGSDPMNDPNVKVGFYNAQDPMVKDSNGGIVRDATFRIKRDAQFEGLFDAKTVNGEIVSTKATDEMWIRDPSYTRDLQLLKAQIQLKMKPDGSLSGYLAGYRPWRPVFDGWVRARGSVIEQLTWVQLPGVYYTLKRHADYAPTPAGEKTHISYAMRVDAIPAYVIDPDAKQQVAAVTSFKAGAPAYRPTNAVSFQAIVVDGIVRRGGTIPGGPNVVIPPPSSMVASTAATGTE